MNFEIRWTPEAEESFEQIISYLETKWTGKEVRQFVQRADIIFEQISEFPFMYEASASNVNIRRAFVTRQCSLFYEVKNDTLLLLHFWDNRMNPANRSY